MANALQDLFQKQGQSPWLDFIRRNMLENGGLKRYVEQDGIRGVTANPTIFAQAIGAGDDYDAQLRELVRDGVAAHDLFEKIAAVDIRQAADILGPVFDEARADGFVSIEVSPEKAYQTQPTIDEAKRWWALIGRPNIMVKIPATNEGLPAVEECIFAGLNINVTLIFALEFYERVMEAYVRGLERRVEAGLDLRDCNSVASFFVSRVDGAADKLIEEKLAAAGSDAERTGLQGLLGKVANANAKVAYERFHAVFGSERFKKLRDKGAKPQRPLWASTGTKNKAYSDILYVQDLIGPDTVNTMPPVTIDAFRDHGVATRTLDAGVEAARRVLEDLDAAGISLNEITDKLQVDGVASFSKSFDEINAITAQKVEQIKKASAA